MENSRLERLAALRSEHASLNRRHEDLGELIYQASKPAMVGMDLFETQTESAEYHQFVNECDAVWSRMWDVKREIDSLLLDTSPIAPISEPNLVGRVAQLEAEIQSLKRSHTEELVQLEIRCRNQILEAEGRIQEGNRAVRPSESPNVSGWDLD